jgi:kynurenine formamidase
MSLDHGSSSTFDVHLTVLGADRYGVENLRNLTQIPARAATVIVGSSRGARVRRALPGVCERVGARSQTSSAR